jgi:hypothetical protein
MLFVALAFVDDAGAAEMASIQAILNTDGSGKMVANVSTGHGGEMWSWQACTDGGLVCGGFGTGQIIETGSASANTVFVATEAIAGATTRSPVWHGDITPATPPSVSGEVRANALVTPVRGTWTGGWDGDFELTQLAACVDAGGANCTTLTAPPAYTDACPDESAVIDPIFTGRYLRVADAIYGPGTAFAAVGLTSPYGGAIWPAGPTTSVAIVGQIASATGPRASACAPPPLESATVSQRGVATIHCEVACRILLRAHHGARRVHTTRTLAGPGTVSVHLARRAVRRLGHGRVAFTVDVDGAELVSRNVTLA